MCSGAWRNTILSLVTTFASVGFASCGVNNHVDGSSSLAGAASIYDRSSGEQTASGEQLEEHALTAAHRSLPFGTVVEVSNNQNGRKTLVRINDRGPFVRSRVIDLTPAAARALGFSGIADVSLVIVSASDSKR
jgi:rare lipoprotein A